jgi:hypothetical protein
MATDRELQPDAGRVDWDGLERDTMRALHMLRVVWEYSQREQPPELHRKMVADLYVPIIEQLAAFIASVKVSVDVEDEDEGETPWPN